MLKMILDKVRVATLPVCFMIFMILNIVFCKLYCGEISNTSFGFSFFWTLLFTGILVMLPTVLQRIGIVGLISFFALSCILHAVMYNLFGNFFAFSDLSYTGDGMAFFSFSYLKVRKLLWIIVIGCILLAVFLAWNLKKVKYTAKRIILGIILCVLGIVGISWQHNSILGNLNVTMTWSVGMEHENSANIYRAMSNKNYAMSMTGIYQYMYRSFMVSSGLENRLNNSEMYEELDGFFAAELEKKYESNEMTGIFKGKNVMFIMLESIDTWMLTKEYMPNLYQIQQDSMNFINHYSPLYISAGTFNTEFIANTGIVPPTSGVDTNVYANNAFPYSLANRFNELGYLVNSFHSSNPNIYNRGNIHENWGYIKYHNWEDMNMQDYMLDSQMMNGYSNMISDEEFFSFIITYSGHGPYNEELQNIAAEHLELATSLVAQKQIEASEEDLLEYIHAIAHAMETDKFVNELMVQLESDGLLSDTVLVFFTDHFGKYMTNHQFVMEMKEIEEKDFLYNTPFFIYNSEISGRTIETISSTIDIAPTIENLFGMKEKCAYYIGTDIFDEGEDHYVIFPGNNWYDGEIYYTPEYQGEITEEISERNREILLKMKCSEYMLKSNYFSYLENNR